MELSYIKYSGLSCIESVNFCIFHLQIRPSVNMIRVYIISSSSLGLSLHQGSPQRVDPASSIWHILRRMPFLTQPSPFIRAWDRHQKHAGWCSPVAGCSHTHLGDNLVTPINLTCMFLGDERKPEYLERTHTGRTCKLTRIGYQTLSNLN